MLRASENVALHEDLSLLISENDRWIRLRASACLSSSAWVVRVGGSPSGFSRACNEPGRLRERSLSCIFVVRSSKGATIVLLINRSLRSS